MSEREPRPEDRSVAGADDELGALLSSAGPRPPLAEEDLTRIALAARSAWRFQLGQRRRRRRLALGGVLGGAVAAVLAGAIALGLWSARSGAQPLVARVESLLGEIEIHAPDAPARRLAAGQEIPAGSRLASSPLGARASLRLGERTTLRIDADTRLRIDSPSALVLERGALYADTGEGARGALEIRTPHGLARDVGTAFSLRLLDDDGGALRVQVRAGSVLVERPGAQQVAPAGEELVIFAGGAVERRALPPFGPAWDWVLDAAPPFEVEGRTLRQLLDWACRESGWTLGFADPQLEAEVATIRVRGGLGALRPDQAPFAVLPGAGLEGVVERGVLVVRRPE